MPAPPSLQAPIISNLRVRACVKYIIWVRKTERKTEYIVSKATKFQLEKYSFLEIFCLLPKMKIFYHELFHMKNFNGEFFPNYCISILFLEDCLSVS